MRDFAANTPFGLRSSLRGRASLAALVLATPGLVAAYDPSDLSTLFQDDAGLIPAGVGDYVKLMRDKSGNARHMRAVSDAARPVLRKGANEATAALYPELVANGTFDSDVSGWTDHSTAPGYTAWDAGSLLLVSGTSGNWARSKQTVSTEVGKTYRIKVRNTGVTTVAVFAVIDATPIMQVPAGATVTAQFTAVSTSTEIGVRNFVANTTVSIDLVSVRQVTGEVCWLEGDGNDDMMVADDGVVFFTTVYTALAYRLLSFSSQFPHIMSHAAPNPNLDPSTRQPLIFHDSAFPTRLYTTYGTRPLVVDIGTSIVGVDLVMDSYITTSASYKNVNGTTVAAAGAALTNTVPEALRIFGSVKANARFYGAIRTHTIPTAAQQAQIRQWLAAKSGGIA